MAAKRIVITKGEFDKFWDEVLGHDWYIDDRSWLDLAWSGNGSCHERGDDD